MSLLSYLLGFLTNLVIFALFSLGLNLQFGHTGLINFGHVAFMGVGAYTMVIIALSGAPLWLAMLVAVITAGAFGLLIGLPVIRLRDDYLAIVTIGFAEIIRMVLNNESWLTRGPQGMFGFPVPFENLGLSPLGHRALFLAWVLLTAGLVFWLVNRLTGSPWGRVLKAIREDETVASSLGKNTVAYKLQALVIGAMIAGLAGVQLALFLRYINPRNFMPLTTFVAWLIMIMGGVGRNWGVVIGSMIYFGLNAATQQFMARGLGPLTGGQMGALRMMLVGLILVLLMLYRPQGILGRKEEMTLES